MSNATTNPPVPRPTFVGNCSQRLDFDGFATANAVLLFVLFVSLGMAISFREVKRELKRPKGIIIAQIGQFLFLPLIGWGMARAFALPVPAAVGLVAITTAPGGAISNIIAVFYQADIPLSVCATAVSSLIAIAMMPLNQYIYLIAAKLAPGVCFNVSGIILSAAIVVTGTTVGVFLIDFLRRRRLYNTIKLMYVLGSASGLAIVVIGFVANLGSKMPITALPGKLVAAAFVPYMLGTIFGLVGGKLAKLPNPSCVTIALEVGIQNKAVALSVLSFIFPADNLNRAASLAMPLVYALFSTCIGFLWVGIAWKCFGWTNLPRDKGFCEAFRIARTKAKEAEAREVSEGDNDKAKVTVSETSSAQPRTPSNDAFALEDANPHTVRIEHSVLQDETGNISMKESATV